MSRWAAATCATSRDLDDIDPHQGNRGDHHEQQHDKWDAVKAEWETAARGHALLADPRLNRGTAFTERERDALDLIGLMPAAVLTLEQQAARAYAQYTAQPGDLAKNLYLRALHDRNEVLFYKLFGGPPQRDATRCLHPDRGRRNPAYSHEFRRPRGVYLSFGGRPTTRRVARCEAAGPVRQ